MYYTHYTLFTWVRLWACHKPYVWNDEKLHGSRSSQWKELCLNFPCAPADSNLLLIYAFNYVMTHLC